MKGHLSRQDAATYNRCLVLALGRFHVPDMDGWICKVRRGLGCLWGMERRVLAAFGKGRQAGGGRRERALLLGRHLPDV